MQPRLHDALFLPQEHMYASIAFISSSFQQQGARFCPQAAASTLKGCC
jgi:hypothetical protein